MQKKGYCIVICALLAILLAGCIPQARSSSQTVTSKPPAQSVVGSVSLETSSEPVAEAIPSIAVGETIVTETREITINHVEFSYDVEPLDKNVIYTHYAADSGEVYIDIAFSVKNIQKQQLKCTNIIAVSADYDNGYTYTGFCVVEDKTLGFAQALTKDIDPLQTVNMRYLIKCPQEVEENTDTPVVLTVTVEGVKYQYILR